MLKNESTTSLNFILTKNQYLSYEEYEELGGILKRVPFNILEFKSRKDIDKMTSNRISKLDTIPIEVKMCVNELINAYKEDDCPILASDGIGAYNPTKRSVEDIEKIKAHIIRKNLKDLTINGENALYCGVD